MRLLKSLSLVSFLGLLSADCPAGWTYFGQGNLCFQVVNKASTYGQSVRDCLQQGGDLAKISDGFLNSAISRALLPNPAYIGVEKQSKGGWTFSDGSQLNYNNWDNGEPSTLATTHCATMDPKTALWKASDCNQFNSYICSKPADPSPCPLNWSYQSVSNACYYLKNFTSANGKTWDVVDVNEAELRCRQMNTKGRLVSIHDALENQIVFDLLKTYSIKDSTMAPPPTSACTAAYSWSGLSYNSARNFAWSDGTTVDWQPPVFKLSGTTYYGMVNDDSCGGKSWGSFSDNASLQLLARYVCKISL